MRMRLTCVVVAIAAVGLLSATAFGAPQLHVASPTFEFGVVTEGERVEFNFLLENSGDELLVIERISASCGCTTADLADREIEPGDVVRLSGAVNTSGFGGIEISKRITIFSNDPAAPETVLFVAGQVVDESAYFIEAHVLSPGLMLLLDVRPYEDYLAGHLAGAISTSGVDWDILVELLPKDVPIVLYDQSGEQAVQLADSMLPIGFANVGVLLGGFDEWVRLYGDRLITDLPLSIGLTAPDNSRD